MEIILTRYPGNLMFAGVCVFNVSTRMGTIKIKWRKVSKVFRNAHTDTRAQLLLFEISEGSTKVSSASVDRTLVGLQSF